MTDDGFPVSQLTSAPNSLEICILSLEVQVGPGEGPLFPYFVVRTFRWTLKTQSWTNLATDGTPLLLTRKSM